MKAVTQINKAMETITKKSPDISFERAAAEAFNKVKQGLATKEIEQRLKSEVEKQKLKETLDWSVPVLEALAESTESGNCNTLKMVTGQPFGITMIGARIMS